MFNSKVMAVLNWITFFMYLQLVWVIFSVLGLVVGGVFPATFAMFGIARKWIRGQSDVPLFKTFFELYKQAFLKANLFGYGTFIIAFSLYYYYRFALGMTGTISTILLATVVGAAIIFIAITLFIAPVYVHFDIKFFDVIRHALVISISYPFHTIAMAVLVYGFWRLTFVQQLVPFVLILGFSLLTTALMFVASLAFANVEEKASESGKLE